MTRDDILRMAREAGRWATNQTGDTYEWNVLRDERFAALVAAAEREECANLIDETHEWRGKGWVSYLDADTKRAISTAIRARGTK